MGRRTHMRRSVCTAALNQLSNERAAPPPEPRFRGQMCGGTALAEGSRQGGLRKMKNMVVVLVIAGCFASGCAGGAGLAQRGAVVVPGESVKAFAAGPAVVHAFSMDRGGDIYTAPATTGTDADCVQGRPRSHDHQTPLNVDQRNVVEVGFGQVACIASKSDRPIELVW